MVHYKIEYFIVELNFLIYFIPLEQWLIKTNERAIWYLVLSKVTSLKSSTSAPCTPTCMTPFWGWVNSRIISIKVHLKLRSSKRKKGRKWKRRRIRKLGSKRSSTLILKIIKKVKSPPSSPMIMMSKKKIVKAHAFLNYFFKMFHGKTLSKRTLRMELKNKGQ